MFKIFKLGFSYCVFTAGILNFYSMLQQSYFSRDSCLKGYWIEIWLLKFQSTQIYSLNLRIKIVSFSFKDNLEKFVS